MREQYNPLPQVKLEAGASYYMPDAYAPKPVRVDSPAFEVMTDLKRVLVATIDPDVPVDEANHVMIVRGVRSLLVTDTQRGILGIVTATDILGEHPMQVVRARGIRHDEVLVQDIMTPRERIEALSMADVRNAEVGHIVASLKRAGRQHALVVEADADGRQLICGIFSASQIARQLGITLHATEVARTFAEIEAAFTP